MVSSYYLVKLFQKASYKRLKKTIDSEGSSSSLNEPKESENVNKCRICLKSGTIPIFGDDNMPNVSVAVRTFGDVEINEDDDYPKHLCEACYKLLEGAILFRKTAKQSHQILRKKKIKHEPLPEDTQSSEFEQEIKEEKPKKSALLNRFFLDIPDIDELVHLQTGSQKIKRKVQCRLCLKIVTKAYFKEHFSLHDTTVSKYMCDVCGKSFRQRCAYKNHYFTHGSEFPFKCSYCPYRGRNSGLLSTHMRTHIGDYRYMCTECPARFLTKSNLNKHTFKHREPLFKCDTCRRAFHSKSLLERHFNVEHLGIKNHICNICGKAFGYRKAMMRHQLDVHKREKKLSGRTPAYLEAEQRKLDDDHLWVKPIGSE